MSTRYRLAALVAAMLFASAAHGNELGDAAGPVELTTLSGERLVMDNYRERPGTAVLFLSSRCDATEGMLAELNRFYQKYRLRNVLIVGVCSNPAETGDELRAFAQRRGIIFPVYRDPSGTVARQFGAQTTPEVFLHDNRGVLVYHGGLHNDKARGAVEAAVLNLLRKQPIASAPDAIEGTPIDRPGPQREIDDPYGAVSFSSELVFEKIPSAAAHHCSSICQAENGDLLCLWYGGSYESADDQALYFARRKLGERIWSEPQILVQNAIQPPGNGVVFCDPQARIWIVWARMESTRPIRRGSGWGRCQLMFRTSADHGATWSDDRRLLERELWCVPRNAPITLVDGTLLLPVEGSLNDVDGSHFLTLGAAATQWQPAGFTSGGSQPAVVQRRDGSLLALMRHSGHITQITSHDGGKTWSDAEATTLANPDAGISMTRLANGHLVLVFNDSQTSRTPLSICRSLDEGKTWEQPLALESNPGEYSYPSVIQSKDGKIHITYTFRRYAIKHVELNENWLVHLRRPN